MRVFALQAVMAALLIAAPGPGPKPTTGPAQTVILVVGASGAPDYADPFNEWAGLWEQATRDARVRLVTLGLQTPGETRDRDLLKQHLDEASTRSIAPLWLVFMGHGTYDGRVAKFNLRGPDLSAEDLGAWLQPVQRPLAIINTSAASAPFIRALSAANRVVITATQSGFEQSATHLGGFLSHALNDAGADLDKDGQTSLLEAFLAASHRVEAFYAGAGRLRTEHALLDDNGDALGTPAAWFRGIRPTRKAADNAPLDGYLAHQFNLCPSAEEARLAPQQRADRNRLEREVFALRDRRDQTTEEDYFKQLETLLTDIARIYQAAEEASSATGR